MLASVVSVLKSDLKMAEFQTEITTAASYLHHQVNGAGLGPPPRAATPNMGGFGSGGEGNPRHRRLLRLQHLKTLCSYSESEAAFRWGYAFDTEVT